VVVPIREQQQDEPSYVRSPTPSPSRIHGQTDMLDPPSYKGARPDPEVARDEAAS